MLGRSGCDVTGMLLVCLRSLPMTIEGVDVWQTQLSLDPLHTPSKEILPFSVYINRPSPHHNTTQCQSAAYLSLHHKPTQTPLQTPRTRNPANPQPHKLARMSTAAAPATPFTNPFSASATTNPDPATPAATASTDRRSSANSSSSETDSPSKEFIPLSQRDRRLYCSFPPPHFFTTPPPPQLAVRTTNTAAVQRSGTPP